MTFAHRAPRLPEGGSLLEVSSSRSGGSVYQDVPLIAVPGQSYTFSIWVRSAATTKANVCVVLWGIGSGIQVHGQTCARVGTTWTQLSAPLRRRHGRPRRCSGHRSTSARRISIST